MNITLPTFFLQTNPDFESLKYCPENTTELEHLFDTLSISDWKV